MLTLKQLKVTVCGVSSTETPEGQRLRVPEKNSQDTVWSGELCSFILYLLMERHPHSVCAHHWKTSEIFIGKVFNKSR